MGYVWLLIVQIPLVFIQMYNQLQTEGVQFFHTACDESEPVMQAFGACSLPGDKEILVPTKSSLLGDAGHAGLGKHPCTNHSHKTQNPKQTNKNPKPNTVLEVVVYPAYVVWKNEIWSRENLWDCCVDLYEVTKAGHQHHRCL